MIARELILKLSDLDTVSLECKSCHVRLLLSLAAVNREQSPPATKLEVPLSCPSCHDDWEKMRFAILQYSETLRRLEQFKVTFHVPEPPR